MMNGYGVLEMSGRLAVLRNDAPTIVQQGNLGTSERDHGLYGYAESVLQQLAGTALPVVWDLRILVHLVPYPMPDKFTDNAIALCLAVGLDCIAYITEALTGNGLLNSFV